MKFSCGLKVIRVLILECHEVHEGHEGPEGHEQDILGHITFRTYFIYIYIFKSTVRIVPGWYPSQKGVSHGVPNHLLDV